MGTEQNYVTGILIALVFILKLKLFMKTFQMMLKDGLIHLTIMKIKLKVKSKRPLPIGKDKKVIGLFKDELEEKIMEEFCVLRAETQKHMHT